jgi:hypothetical protein
MFGKSLTSAVPWLIISKTIVVQRKDIMPISIEALVGLMVVLVLTVLIMVAWLAASFRQDRSKKKQPRPAAQGSLDTDTAPPDVTARADERAGDVVEQVSPIIVDTPTEPVSALPASRPLAPSTQTRQPVPGDVLLMQVWRDREGFLVVEVEGQRYRRLFDIRDGEVGQRVWDIINRLLSFSKGRESRVPLPPAPQVSQDRAPTSAPALGDISAGRSQAFFEQLQQPDALAPARKPRLTVDPVPFRSRDTMQDALISLNLAAEIDQLLQIHVKASPEFSRRFIHVRSAPDGMLRFRVDEGHYSSIDEIPDLQIQALIRATIAEWDSHR